MDIEQRLLRLERQNRRLKWCLTGLVLLAVASVLIGQVAPAKVPKVVQANRFEVIGDNGKPLVVLKSRFGFGTIQCLGPQGRFLMEAGVRSDVAGLLSQLSAEDRAKAMAKFPLRGTVSTFGPIGQRAVILSSMADGKGSVTTFDGMGHELVRISAAEDGNGTVATFGRRGQDLVRIGGTAVGEGAVTTFGGKGHAQVRLGANLDGGGTMTAFSITGDVKAVWP